MPANSASPPPGPVERLLRRGLIAAERAHVERVGLEGAERRKRRVVGLGRGDCRVLVVAVGEIVLGLVAREVFEELDRLARVRRVLHDTGAGDVDVRAAPVLVRPDHAGSGDRGALVRLLRARKRQPMLIPGLMPMAKSSMRSRPDLRCRKCASRCRRSSRNWAAQVEPCARRSEHFTKPINPRSLPENEIPNSSSTFTSRPAASWVLMCFG